MKYIHLVIKKVDCDHIHATSLVYNNCLELEMSDEMIIPNNISENEIAQLIIPTISEYKMSFAHIGGGGIKRPN